MNPVRGSLEIVTSYHSSILQLDFINRAGKVFAQKVSKDKPPIPYKIAPSVFTIQTIPANLDQSQTIRWLLANQYFPIIEKQSIFFMPPLPSCEVPVQIDGRGSPLQLAAQKGNQDVDVEMDVYTKLLEAKKSDDFREQIFYIEKLSDSYLQKSHWAQAAKLLNGALAILEKDGNDNQYAHALREKLEQIEIIMQHI